MVSLHGSKPTHPLLGLGLVFSGRVFSTSVRPCPLRSRLTKPKRSGRVSPFGAASPSRRLAPDRESVALEDLEELDSLDDLDDEALLRTSETTRALLRCPAASVAEAPSVAHVEKRSLANTASIGRRTQTARPSLISGPAASTDIPRVQGVPGTWNRVR